jgi:hypothetical protein
VIGGFAHAVPPRGAPGPCGFFLDGADAGGAAYPARQRAWFEELASGQVRSLADIARRENVAVRYVERLSRLVFTAPSIVETICQGCQPAELNAETLLDRIDLPLEWPAQLVVDVAGSARTYGREQ